VNRHLLPGMWKANTYRSSRASNQLWPQTTVTVSSTSWVPVVGWSGS
jgi:hypothetical protein